MIDVLLPFHRYDKFLMAAINSVFNSKSVKIRLILIDDRSDQSIKLHRIETNGNELEVLQTSGNFGYGKSLELGTSVLQNDFVGLMNSDDLVHESRFINQIQALDVYDLSLTGINSISMEDRKLYSLLGENHFNNYSPAYLLFGSYGANATWSMTREWWIQHSFFDSLPCLDWRIAMQTFPYSRISYRPETRYFYRKHPHQITKNKIKHEEMTPVYETWKELCNHFGINSSSRENFDLVATPWLKNKVTSIKDFNLFISECNKLKSKSSYLVKLEIDNLIRKRTIFTVYNSHIPIRMKIKIIIDNFKDSFALVYQLFSNLIVQRYEKIHTIFKGEVKCQS